MFNKCLGTFLIMVTITAAKGDSVTTLKPPAYLGSGPTKPYFFPWLVTFHRETASKKEFFGSGSIITSKWVVGSMDCFIRPTRDDHTPYFSDIGSWEVHSGGIWANIFERTGYLPDDISWLQIRKVAEVLMLSDPDQNHSKWISFSASALPSSYDLNGVKRSPFGFSLSLALIRVKKIPGLRGPDEWEWKRSALPIPLASKSDVSMKNLLQDTFNNFEESPSTGICHVGGWRVGDWRLVEYEVVYVPFDRCRDIFCANDDRACFTWPVRGVHVCFKSLTYTDPCWRDQGSALYCTLDEEESVVAILTSAPTCGSGGLPGVFTLAHWGLNMLSRVASFSQEYEPISKEDRNKYTPPPEKDLIAAYG